MVTWLKFYIGVSMAAVFAAGWIYIYKHDYKNNQDRVAFPAKHLYIAALLLLVWLILAGSGKLFYESWDWNFRNAVFRDLIERKWPVVYEEKETALVYYLLQWIVPAAFGKIAGWHMGNIALLLWNYIGILTSYLLLVLICKNSKKAGLYTVLVIFIFWGGGKSDWDNSCSDF